MVPECEAIVDGATARDNGSGGGLVVPAET